MQEVVVGIIVAYAAWAVAKRYAPVPVRQALTRWTVRSARRIGLAGLAARLEAKASGTSSCADGCGPCGGCGSTNKPVSPEFSITPEDLKRTARR